jgi:nucleotidyltransferase substrate binding protein (TIGR01987 family)
MELTTPRWQQRFENFNKALANLSLATTTHQSRPTDVLVRIAVIKTFEITFELGWKTLKDYLNFNGVDVKLPREVLKQAFANGLVPDGQVWINMLEDRNLMAHTYDDERALLAIEHICTNYLPAIKTLQLFFNERV